MANRNIRDFFKPMQPPSANKSTHTLASSTSAVAASTVTSQTSTATTMPNLSISSPILGTDPKVNPLARQRVVRSSDDEESDSDSSIEDLTSFIQNKMSKPQDIGSQPNILTDSTNSRFRNIRKNSTYPRSPAKQTYKFDMKVLMNQAEKDEAAEASARRVDALLNEAAAKSSMPGSSRSSGINNELLQKVVADGDDVPKDDVLQALKRTEATITDRRCYFFNAPISSTLSVWPFPRNENPEGWKRALGNPQLREQTVLSGFAKDMIALGDVLPDEIFLWMLDEICLEMREDLRNAYCTTLAASPQQLLNLVRPEVITSLFQKIGATGNAVDVHQEVQLVPLRASVYEGRDWTSLRALMTFLGQISQNVSPATRSHSLSLLVRLCADREILENIGILDALQRSMEHICSSIGSIIWEECCQNICSTIYSSVVSASLRFQVLRCIPRTSPRLHDLRRRMALAYFFEDISYSTRTPELAVDLYEVTKRLEERQFKITRETDYIKLAAQMGMLDILVDNGISAEYDVADFEGEKDFNSDVDRVIARIGNTSSSINDAGAAFMSRVDAKEVMEGFRHRLMFAVRTKPQPRKGVFDIKAVDNSEQIRKQSELMMKHFNKQVKA